MLLVTIIWLPSPILRIVLGLPFVLFFPGYALTAALFPRKEETSGVIERVALSFGLSIAVVPLLGLILNYTRWGLTLESIFYCLASFIFVISVVAWFRQRGIPQGGDSGAKFRLPRLNWGTTISDKVLSIVLIFAMLGALGMAGYAIAKPKVGQKFTEFYLLEDKAGSRYQKQLVVGQKAGVSVGIVNEEYRTISYQVELRINGVSSNETGPILLGAGGKWEGEIGFVPESVGQNQTLEFFLYKDGVIDTSFQTLRLWIEVVPKER